MERSRAEVDRDLLRRYHEQGDVAAREELVQRHLPLVRSLARRFAGRGESLEDLDDLQLAVERLLVEAASQDTVMIRIDVVDHGVRVGVGPLVERTIADALQGPDAEPGELTLRRILQTVVDSFAVENAEGGIVVRLQKAVPGR